MRGVLTSIPMIYTFIFQNPFTTARPKSTLRLTRIQLKHVLSWKTTAGALLILGIESVPLVKTHQKVKKLPKFTLIWPTTKTPKKGLPESKIRLSIPIFSKTRLQQPAPKLPSGWPEFTQNMFYRGKGPMGLS